MATLPEVRQPVAARHRSNPRLPCIPPLQSRSQVQTGTLLHMINNDSPGFLPDGTVDPPRASPAAALFPPSIPGPSAKPSMRRISPGPITAARTTLPSPSAQRPNNPSPFVQIGAEGAYCNICKLRVLRHGHHGRCRAARRAYQGCDGLLRRYRFRSPAGRFFRQAGWFDRRSPGIFQTSTSSKAWSKKRLIT